MLGRASRTGGIRDKIVQNYLKQGKGIKKGVRMFSWEYLF